MARELVPRGQGSLYTKGFLPRGFYGIMIAHSCNPKRLPRSAPRRILFCVRGILDGTKEVRNYL